MRSAPAIAFLLAAAVPCALGGDVNSPVKTDETVIFFTSAAWPAGEPGKWATEVRGIIFEKESRPLLAAGFRQALGVEVDKLTGPERTLLDERIRLFLADNERAKSIPVSIGDECCQLPESAPNGHFRGTLTFPAAGAKPVTIRAMLREGDARQFTGTLLPMPDTVQPMIVSDVDDTIKITHVRDRAAAIRNTFCAPCAEVPGMAVVYKRWAKRGAAFHYVSGSPWQLYTPLEQFTRDAGFPAGAWHLKHLRLADPETVLAFLGPQQEYKLNAIRPLLERWKQRRFILVGDTGEQDPEIYATLAREHPARIARILLRNVSSETRDNPRMTAACKGVPAEKWLLFDKPEELPARLDAAP